MDTRVSFDINYLRFASLGNGSVIVDSTIFSFVRTRAMPNCDLRGMCRKNGCDLTAISRKQRNETINISSKGDRWFAKNYFAQYSTIKRFLMHPVKMVSSLSVSLSLSLCRSMHVPPPRAPRTNQSYASQVHRFSVNRNADNYRLRDNLSLLYISHFLSCFRHNLPFFDDLLKLERKTRLASKTCYRFSKSLGFERKETSNEKVGLARRKGATKTKQPRSTRGTN